MNRKNQTSKTPPRIIHSAAKTPKRVSAQKPFPSQEKLNNNKSKELVASKTSASKNRDPKASLSRDSMKTEPKNASLTPISKTKKNSPHSNLSSIQRKKPPKNDTLDRILEKYLQIDEKPSLSPQPKEEKSQSFQVKQNDSSIKRSLEKKNSFARRGSTEEIRRQQLNRSHEPEMRNIVIYRLKITELSRKYTVYEDWRILESAKYSKDVEGVRGILSPKRWETIRDPKTNSRLLNGDRTSESMRERYRRYLMLMNSEDLKVFYRFVESHSEEEMKQYGISSTKKQDKSPDIWTPPDSTLSLPNLEKSERKNKFSESTLKSYSKILPPDLLTKSEKKTTSLSKSAPIKNVPFPVRILARAKAQASKTFYAKKRLFSPEDKNGKNLSPSPTKEFANTFKKIKLSSPQPRPKDSLNFNSILSPSQRFTNLKKFKLHSPPPRSNQNSNLKSVITPSTPSNIPSRNTSYLKSSDRPFDSTNSREKRHSNQTTASESMESALTLDQNLKNLADLKIDYMILINCKNGTREFIETNKILGADQATAKELCKLAKTYKTTLGEIVNLVNKHNNSEKY